jgi:hypothetical protein
MLAERAHVVDQTRPEDWDRFGESGLLPVPRAAARAAPADMLVEVPRSVRREIPPSALVRCRTSAECHPAVESTPRRRRSRPRLRGTPRNEDAGELCQE